jgi:hypothetical protein
MKLDAMPSRELGGLWVMAADDQRNRAAQPPSWCR